MGEGEKNEWGTDSGERLRERDCLACGEKQVACTRKNSHRYDADRGEKGSSHYGCSQREEKVHPKHTHDIIISVLLRPHDSVKTNLETLGLRFGTVPLTPPSLCTTVIHTFQSNFSNV